MSAAGANSVGVSIPACLHRAKSFASSNICLGDKAFVFAVRQNGGMNYIREWRAKKKLSQQALGEALEPPASPGTISSYEGGSRKPSQRRLEDIARVLETTPGALLDHPPSDDNPDGEMGKVVSIFSKVPPERRQQAIEVLRTFAAE